jgi:DNA-binding transcriptional MerR regulator
MTDPAKRALVPEPPDRRPRASPTTTHASPPCEPSNALTSLAIGDLAREFEISTRAIRFYEARGLLHPARRGTVRIFGPADRQRLSLILRAKNLGLTLEEIAEHLAIYDAETSDRSDLRPLKARTDRHIAALTAKRADLQATLKELRDIRTRLAARLARPGKP